MKLPKAYPLALGLLLLAHALFGQPSIDDLTPARVAIGESFTLHGSGFDAQKTYTVTVGDESLTVTDVSETELSVTAGTQSGLVSVAEDGQQFSREYYLSIVMSVAGTFAPPAGINPSGYYVMNGSESVAVNPDGIFTITVSASRAGVLWAYRNEDDPMFFGMHVPGDGSLVIDADSTATASLFLSPIITTRDMDLAEYRRDIIQERGPVATLAHFIQASASDGYDYMNDGRFDTLYTDALEDVSLAISQSPPPNAAPLLASLSRENEPTLPVVIKSLNRDEIPGSPASDGAVGWMKVKVERRGDIGDGSDYFVVTLENKQNRFLRTDNPLSWLFSVYEIDPSQFNNREEVENFDNSEATFDFVQPGYVDLPAIGPYYLGSIDADLGGADVDIGEVVINKVFAAFEEAAANDYNLLTGNKPTFTPAKNQFLVPGDREGIYVIQAFSGNLAFGYEHWDDLGSVTQIPVLNSQDKLSQWQSALVLNVVILSFDLLSVADLPQQLGDVVQEVFIDVSQLLSAEFAQQRELNRALVYAVVRQSAVSALEAIVKKKSGSVVTSTLNGIKFFGKAITKFFDLSSNVSAFVEFGQRTNGLLLKQCFATERFLVVLGNPFKAKIDDFRPRQGRGGDVITITGYNFPEEPLVSFCREPRTRTDDEDPEYDSKAEATVVRSDENSISVQVPENWETALGADRLTAYICIEEAGESHIATTEGRTDIPETFTYIPKPAIVSLSPETIYPGTTVIATVERSAGDRAEMHRIFLDDNQQCDIVSVSGDTIAFRVPDNFSPGFNSVTVQLLPYTSYVSDPYGFLISARPEDTATKGLGAIVSTTADSDVMDGSLSLREALLILSGQRGFTQRPDGVDSGAYEDDWLFETDGALIVEVDDTVAGQTITAGSAMPGIPSGCKVDLDGVTLDMTSGGTAFLNFDNRLSTKLEDVTITNFTGNGISIKYANLVQLNAVSLLGCSGVGVTIEESQSIWLKEVVIENPGSHGMHITGPTTRGVVIEPGLNPPNFGHITNATGYGVLVDDGVQQSRIDPGDVRNCTLGGIRINGASCDNNVIGFDSHVRPTLPAIVDNGGHGVHVTGGPDNLSIRWLLTAGNAGDGVRVDGPASGYRIDSIFSGLDLYDTSPGADTYAFPRPKVYNPKQNTGHGLALYEVDDSAVGGVFPAQSIRGYGERFGLANNAKSGIYMENCNNVTVASGHLGDIFSLDFEFELIGAHIIPNGENGIHIKGGSGNSLGGMHSYYDLHISGAPNGAGILIEDSDANIVFGNQIGTDHGFVSSESQERLKYGVHIKGQSRDNKIGLLGGFFEIPFTGGEEPPYHGPYRPFNIIVNCLEAGVFIDNAGGTPDFGNPALPDRPNIVQNNFIGQDEYTFLEHGNAVGILLEGTAYVNIIGGPTEDHGNIIRFNDDAGIRLRNMTVSDPDDRMPFRVRIGGNFIYDQGKNHPGPVQPLLDGFPGGVGIHLDHCTGCVLTHRPLADNTIDDNHVGVMVEGGGSNQISTLNLNDNLEAGMVLRDTSDNLVSPQKPGQPILIKDNGDGTVSVSGGLILADSDNNTLRGLIVEGNTGDGILIHDSSNNIFDGFINPGLSVRSNTRDGIRIEGSQSTSNQLLNFDIGFGVAAAAPNGANGIHLRDGASGNQIGDGFNTNRIANHAFGAGVLISGGSTVGNSIRNNLIYDNNGGGIIHQGGGNNDQPGPIISNLDIAGRQLEGTVTNTVEIPAGSRIEAYSDYTTPPQGRAYLGHTFVNSGGTWSMYLPAKAAIYSKITTTATNANTGDTSEFTFELGLERSLNIARSSEDDPTTVTFSSNREGLTLDHYTVSTTNAVVIVDSITCQLSGTIDDASVFARLEIWQDADENGRIGDSDVQLGEFTGLTDNGAIEVPVGATLNENESQRWLLRATLATPPGNGQTVSVSVLSEDDVSFSAPSYPAGIVVNGDFPIVSDAHQATTSDAYALFQANYFGPDASNPAIAGRFQDPDGDGIINWIEFLLGLDPTTPGSHRTLDGEVVDGKYRFTYRRLQGQANDAELLPEFSADLEYWFSDASRIVDVTTLDNGDGTDTVTVETTYSTDNHRALFGRLLVVEP